ncbi:MAG: DEAD/DEAH box helicase [Bryobacteraceae bacterium]|nr:DEAD/DEAH box helicase [Bryobacteraceae bacterium]
MLTEIVEAIRYEAELSSVPTQWPIEEARQMGALWKVGLSPRTINDHLDESFEGAGAWWAGPPRGSGDVLAVAPDEFEVVVRYASTPVPGVGLLSLYPPRFLDTLAGLYESPFRGRRFLEVLAELETSSAEPRFQAPSPDAFPELRRAQREAFELLRYRFAYLWGPPGTGKTHTLGTMVAAFLQENPGKRVLLISSTNTAVDLSLVSVDTALARLPESMDDVWQLRRACKRVGVHFHARHYDRREHLLPRFNPELVREIARLQGSRPEPSDMQAYLEWKERIEKLQTELRSVARDVFSQSRLVAMTCARGEFSFTDLEDIGPFDLVVFDEASQVGLAHILPFLTVAEQALFAGDPRQLAPIVRAEDREVRRWLGRTAFDFMDVSRANAVILDEQSRMAEPISHIVSDAFYDGRLKVCARAAADPRWRRDRAGAAVEILKIPAEGRGTKTGYCRAESAVRIAEAVREALRTFAAKEIAVITPYRLQRHLIRKELLLLGIRNVEVQTVHRSQGSERRAIFFDPVLGSHRAVSDRLVNVALSRAQARLVIAFSRGDLLNPRLARIYELCARPMQYNVLS